MSDWLFFFHTLPSKPVAARVKIWRQLSKTGAFHLKGSVYVLPFSREHQELFFWLTQQIEKLGGEADFVTVERTANLDQAALQGLFVQSSEQAYKDLQPDLEALERALSLPKGRMESGTLRKLAQKLRRLRSQFEDLARVDFFAAPAGSRFNQRLAALEKKLHAQKKRAKSAGSQPARPAVPLKRLPDYQGRLWVTRERPFVDRMASAWLIRRFIDPSGCFAFTVNHEAGALPPDAVGFDLPGGEFSHLGDWCTFEVLVKAFGLRDKVLTRLAQLVHELDLNDDKYDLPQARGVEEVLRGIQRTADGDLEALEKGMDVFEMLYASTGKNQRS